MYLKKFSVFCFLPSVFCILLTAYYLLFSISAFASDEPFTFASNRGDTGIMEIPTARVMRRHTYRLGYSQIKPYRYYFGAISPMKGLEIVGRVTEILGTEITKPGWQGYGNDKDKAIDFKVQLIPEGRYMPAFALGVMDPHGTRLYPSQYIAASKQIYPFDLTIGFGNGRFGKEPLISQAEKIKLEILTDTQEWLENSQFFWGIQFAPSKKYALMFEYNPIQYHKQIKDPAQKRYFIEPVPSQYNFGFRYKPTKWSELDLSYQRGSQIGFSLTTGFNIGKPLIPIYDPPYKESVDERFNPLPERVTKALYYSGFSDIVVQLEDNELWIEAQNNKYYYTMRAIWVILDTIIQIMPENIEKVYIILKENGIPVVEVKTIREDIYDLHLKKLNIAEFLCLAEINTDILETKGVQGVHKRQLEYGIKPTVETFLNDPSGFFKYRIGLLGLMNYHPWKGASLAAGTEWYPVNTVSTVNKPLSIPVRSDIVFYKREKIALGRLLFEQIHKAKYEIYGRIAGGLLEVQYAGIDAEIAKPILNGKILIGLGGSVVKKRDPDNPLKLKQDNVKDVYTTAFINTRFNFPKKEIAIDVKAGRFLAGDNGIKITISKFINGVIIGVWYSATDTSVFKDDINRNYNDKGISVSIPLRLFKGTDSKIAYNWSLSPWTRDTGQDIEHLNRLFDYMDKNTKISIDKSRRMMY